jgi:BirA family transcriptional regulator, biotin operon repressor / biotin---[acetyl-CoA-carboxylase] ligase
MIGGTVIELDRVDSTNTYASHVVGNTGLEDGAVIWAHEQFAGRGQHDHGWNSEAGKNLTFTVCLKPGFLAPDQQFQLNKAICLGVLDFIRTFPFPVSRIPHPVSSIPDPFPCIKWPNDIYIGEQKMGGILIENRIMGSSLETSFAGIGLNINQTRFAPDIPNPVSLIHLLRHETMLKDALLTLCGFLDKRYQELKNADMAGLDDEFNQNLLGFGEWRTYLREGDEMEGKIRGVDNTGRLMIEHRNGDTLCLNHGEITYVH